MDQAVEKAVFETLLKYAKEGNAECQNYIGYYILQAETPEGVTVDEDPVDMIRRSAEQGWPAAQFNMGLLCEEGFFVEKDERQAFEWYSKAAKQKCLEAMTALGLCHYKGIGVPVDLTNALSWLTAAAEEDDSRAQLLLAEIYAKDERCLDKDKALYWFCRMSQDDPIRCAALQKYVLVPPYYDQVPPEAHYEMDWYPPYPKMLTHEEFCELLAKAEHGDVIAMCQVADCYKEGNGTVRNIEQMVYWGNKYLDSMRKK